jgi:hypothetical protein
MLGKRKNANVKCQNAKPKRGEAPVMRIDQSASSLGIENKSKNVFVRLNLESLDYQISINKVLLTTNSETKIRTSQYGKSESPI